MAQVQRSVLGDSDLVHTAIPQRLLGRLQRFNYTLGLRNSGNMLTPPILQHSSTGAISSSSVYTANSNVIDNVGFRRNTLKGYAVWELPLVNDIPTTAKYVVNGWQLSAVYTGGNGAPYDVTYSYASNSANVNLTGSPQYFARIKVGSGAGSGCGSSQYAQINAAAFSGPAYNSIGNESGSALFNYCFITDVAVQRSFNLFNEQRRLSFRLDAFNAFNTVVFNAANTTMNLNSPATPTAITDNQFLSTGALNTARITAANAGFGAATGRCRCGLFRPRSGSRSDRHGYRRKFYLECLRKLLMPAASCFWRSGWRGNPERPAVAGDRVENFHLGSHDAR
jgi:hypothetical protein